MALVDISEQTARGPLDSGLICYRAGEYAAAAEQFREALRDEPDNADALRLYGLALVRDGRAVAGLPALARARRLAWQEPLAHLHHGIGLLEAGQPGRAAAVLRRAATLAPSNPAVGINFSAALLALERAPAARAAARRAVTLAPDMAEAHHALGLAQLAAADYAAAEPAFLKAVRLRKDFAAAWLNLGMARYRAGRAGGAIAAMREALAANPANSGAEANLAALVLLAGDTDEALTRLRRVLARDPGCIPARLNLANTLLLERQPADALAVLDGPVPAGREGRHWRAHRALAQIELGRWDAARSELDAIAEPYGDAEILVLWRRIGLAEHDRDDATAAALVERMERAVEQEGVSLLEHRIIGHFDLARLHHRHGRKGAAFQHWVDGHRLLGSFQPYDRSQAHAFTSASIAAFGAERLAGPRADDDDPAPVFIVGMPRSGTTLAEQILAAHPTVFAAGERSAVHRLVERLGGPSDLPHSVHRLAALGAETLTQAAKEFLDELHTLDSNARLVVDKMPGNARHLGFLALLVPGARFIHCRRDPRDIGLSIFQFRFFGYHPYAHDLGDLGFAIAEHERLMAHWQSVLGPRLIEVDLSAWIDDFRGTLDRVLGFLGLPYDPACERFYEQTRPVRTASAIQVRRPINRQGIGRFRAYAAQLEPLFRELDRAGLVTWSAEDLWLRDAERSITSPK